MSSRHTRRRGRRKRGQVIIITALVIVIVVLSVVSLVSQTVNLSQGLKYEPYKEVTEVLASSFRSALASALANVTTYLSESSDPDAVQKAREAAYRYISKWKEAAMTAYADLGLQIEFTTPFDQSSAYVLQGEKTIAFPVGDDEYYDEYIDPWKLYNLTQVYWDQSTGCSACYATLYVNLTEYGFYGWKKDIVVAANATVYPDSFKSVGGRAPADIVLVLDSSGSMFFQAPDSGDKNDHTMHIEGQIDPTGGGWTTVETLDLGEIPTQFKAILTWSTGQNLDFQLVNGSTNPKLVIQYSDALGDHTERLSPVADAYVRSLPSQKNKNFGGEENLWVQNFQNNLYRTWMKFDLSSIPSGATIQSAYLSLYVTTNFQAVDRTFWLHHSEEDNWGQMSIRWTNQPDFDGDEHVDSNAPNVGWIAWDVTSDVLNDFGDDDDKKSSWVIRDCDEGGWPQAYIVMASREYAGAAGAYTLSSTGSVGSRIVWSTDDGSEIVGAYKSGTAQGKDFGRSNMLFYGKSDEWMIQIKNPGPGTASYTVDVYTRKLDQARNAATTFLRLLNPELDRIAIVQYGAASIRSSKRYYHASRISKSAGDPFYNLSDPVELQAAIDDINWRNGQGSPTDDIGYGFQWLDGKYYSQGNTPLGAGVEIGANLFNGTNGARDGSQRILIVITDGKENVRPKPRAPAGPYTTGEWWGNPPYYSVESDLTGDAYTASDVITYTIGFGADVDGNHLKQLAQSGQGSYYYAANGTELEQILASLAYQLNDQLSFHFKLAKEHEIAINTLSGSSLNVYILDPVTHQLHKAEPSEFYYLGGGNFFVTLSLAGWQTPEAVIVVVRDPRGILVRLNLPLAAWEEQAG